MISQNSRSDSRDRAKNGATNSAKERKDLKNPHSLLLQIQSTFDKGNKIEFFKAFDALIPSELKKRDLYSYVLLICCSEVKENNESEWKKNMHIIIFT